MNKAKKHWMLIYVLILAVESFFKQWRWWWRPSLTSSVLCPVCCVWWLLLNLMKLIHYLVYYDLFFPTFACWFVFRSFRTNSCLFCWPKSLLRGKTGLEFNVLTVRNLFWMKSIIFSNIIFLWFKVIECDLFIDSFV